LNIKDRVIFLKKLAQKQEWSPVKGGPPPIAILQDTKDKRNELLEMAYILYNFYNSLSQLQNDKESITNFINTIRKQKDVPPGPDFNSVYLNTKSQLINDIKLIQDAYTTFIKSTLQLGKK